MDPNLEQKVAELTRAESQCIFLEDAHREATEALDIYGQESDYEHSVILANLLLAAREDKLCLEIAVKKAKEMPESADYEDEYDNTPFGPMPYFMLNHYSIYTYGAVVGLIGFIALCVAMG